MGGGKINNRNQGWRVPGLKLEVAVLIASAPPQGFLRAAG